MTKENLESELEHMFRDDLIVACQYWGIDISGSSSTHELKDLLAEKMRDPEARKRVFNTFAKKELDLLGILSLSGGAMSNDRLKPFRRIYSYGQLNQTERDLRKKGIIIRRIMSRLTEYGREVAEFKIMDFFIPHLRELFSEKPEEILDKPKDNIKFVNQRDTLLIDILQTVSYFAKNEVKLTSSWEFPKREMEKIIERLSEPTEERFEIVQKTGKKSTAYTMTEDDYVLPANVKRVFNGNQERVSRRILLSALGRTRAIWASSDQPTEYSLNLIICRLREADEGDWIRVDDLHEWIRSELYLENQPLKWLKVDEERVRLALETPILLGIVESAYKGDTVHAIRLTDMGANVIYGREKEHHDGQDTFFVVPNFEITAFTTEMNYYNLYRLMLISEPVKTDVVSTFQITEESIFRAVEMGLRETEILEFLQKESSKPVPDNVVRSIEDWTSQTTFAVVSDVTIFETDTERELDHLMLLEEFTKYVERRIGPKAVILEGDIESLTEDLEEHKCHIRKADEEPRESKKGHTLSMPFPEDAATGSKQGAEDLPDECEGCPAVHSCNRVVRRRSDE